MLFKRTIDKFRNQNRALARSGLLNGLSPAERHEYLQHCHRREYKAGEQIYHQNDPASGIYFIESGQVELSAEVVRENGEIRQSARLLSAPEYFGEISFGYEIRRYASAKCVTDAVLLGFFRPDFETLKRRHPMIALAFLESYTTRVNRQLEVAAERLDHLDESEAGLLFRLGQQEKKSEGGEHV